ncbi:hypothetical protein BJX65DRAFT_302703 [Aspergillus insuetus]
MPHLIHHKRRHSWPYCGTGMSTRDRRNVPIITVTEPDDEFETEFLTPIMPEDLYYEDDAASAGIDTRRAHHRLWHSSRESTGDGSARVDTVSLRKIVQPPLDRARSLFVLPTTVSGKEIMLLPYWVHRLAAHPIAPQPRGRLALDKNHRRCHSERPRSWKQPSEKLWTLKEE